MTTPIDVHGTPTVGAGPTTDPRSGLRTLYVIRFVFAVAWAGSFLASAATLNGASVALLLLYPLVDVAAAVVDFRSSGRTRPRAPLYATMALSLLTALALVLAVTSGIPDVLRVWGAWAVTAGIMQLVLAIVRRRLDGQWPMILSGAISAVAGTSFFVQANGSNPSLKALAGYATLGGIFFLVSGLRLGRSAVKP